MTKLRKQRRRKVYRHSVNRKRMRNKMYSQGNIECKPIKDAWESRKSVQRNLLDMGLSHDPNITIKTAVPSKTPKLQQQWAEEAIDDETPTRVQPGKLNVLNTLIEEAKAPREKLYRVPKPQARWITYLLDAHGTDYKAMERDKKNYNQETWKQLRAKVRKFKKIPQQYEKYKEVCKNPSALEDSECESDGDI